MVTQISQTGSHDASEFNSIHGELVCTDGTTPLLADWDAGSFQIRAETFQSDVATGTAPLTVASTTKVANLNADQVDGKDSTDFLLLDGSQAMTGTFTPSTGSHPIQFGPASMADLFVLYQPGNGLTKWCRNYNPSTGTSYYAWTDNTLRPMVITLTDINAQFSVWRAAAATGSAGASVTIEKAPFTAGDTDLVGTLTVYGTTDLAGGAASTTKVTNLNADMVDGIHAASAATANQLLALNASSKLPASITGDADTVDGYHSSKGQSCRVYLGTAQSIPNNTSPTVALDSVNFDSGSNFDITGHSYIVPATGIYRISAQAYWPPNTNGVRVVHIYQDTTVISKTAVIPGGYDIATTVHTLESLTAGQNIYMGVYQNSGASLDLGAGREYTYMTVQRVE